jgi:anaerobic dimethyl sulfoxide reductase subunit B (iron-sulfur subunit)
MTGFLLDLNRCVGCGACVLACRIENRLPDSVSWRRILPFNIKRNPRGPTYHFSLACHHCQVPPCAKACPSGALEKRPDGIVFLHTDRCLGCRYCEMACPFGAPTFDEASSVMTKCHLCLPRREEGREPACVEACPTKALRIPPPGSPEDTPTSPGVVPGFVDPGPAGANLHLSPPSDGLRGDRYQRLMDKLLGRGEGSDG